MSRKLLGTASNWFTRVRVYLADDAVEIDEIEGYTGTRKRVLFDEVLLLTLDRRRRLTTVAIHAAFGSFFGLMALLTWMLAPKLDQTPALIVAGLGIPFWLLLLLHLAAGVDHVTVFGKRTTAQMRFSLRKGRARAVFALLRNRVREAQRPAIVEAQPAPSPATDVGGTAAA
jgi:hypothetical protein